MGEFCLLAKSIYEQKTNRIKTVVKYLLYLPQMPYLMNNHSEPIIKSTVCPRNCYSSCSFKVELKQGKIHRIFPHDGNKATPEGVCLKGLSYLERAYAKDRIIYPLKRKENGDFERISWDDALNIIAEKLSFYKENFGAKSILFYAASGMSGLLNEISGNFWRIFGGATTMYGNLCWPAGLEATRLTLGENKHNAPWDLEHAKLIIIWGKNPAETNVQEIIHLQKAIENGAKVVLIDPRKSDTAPYAHMHIRPKPATDAALALAIAHLLVKNKQVDYSFIEKYVLGFEPFSQHVEKYTPDYAENICGVDKKQIEGLAQLMAEIKPMTIILGYGMQRYSNGGQTIRALLSLQVITGNLAKKGACWHYANLQSYVFDKVKEPESYYPPKESDGLFRRTVSMAKLGKDMIRQTNPTLKMIWVERGNPVAQNPNTHSIIKAFNQLEFRVVVEQFMTDTAQMADLILPAKNMFEQSDIVGGYWNPYVQLKPKLVEPAGEVKPETEIYYLLAKKLQISPELIAQNLIEPNNEAVENWLKNKLKEFPEIKWEDLEKGPQLASSHEEIAFENGKFNTPSGKIELFSEQAVQKWNVSALPDYVAIEEFQQSKFPLYMMSPNTKNRIHSQFNNLPGIKMLSPEPYAYIHPQTAKNYGIKKGDKIKIWNQRGQIITKVKIDNGMAINAVLVHNGWQLINGTSPNMLSEARETDMGFGTAFHDNKVEITIVI